MHPVALCDAIVFDVGGTLLCVAHDPQENAHRRYVRDGGVSFEAFRASLDAAVEAWREAGGEARHEDLADTWVHHYQHALSAAGFRGDCAATAQRIEASFLTDGWEVYRDVVPTLEALVAHGIPLGVVSNWPPTLEDTLKAAGLRKYFSVVVSSGVVGYAKPRPEIFRCAVDQLRLDPARVLYVGDSISHDFRGAQAAGMQAMLLDRGGAHSNLASRIESLEALLPLLQYAASRERPNPGCC